MTVVVGVGMTVVVVSVGMGGRLLIGCSRPAAHVIASSINIEEGAKPIKKIKVGA